MLSEHLLSSSHDTDSAAGLVEAQMAEDVLDKLVKGVDTASISSKKGLSVAYYRLGSVLAKQVYPS